MMKKTIVTIAGIAGLTCALTAQVTRADEGDFGITLNGASIHLSTDSETRDRLNESNLGLGFEYRFERSGLWSQPWYLVGGFFEDSNFNDSYYAGFATRHTKRLSKSWNWGYGVSTFLMSRKNHQEGEIFPGILPFVSFGTKNTVVNVAYIPEFRDDVIPALFFQLTLSLPGQRSLFNALNEDGSVDDTRLAQTEELIHEDRQAGYVALLANPLD